MGCIIPVHMYLPFFALEHSVFWITPYITIRVEFYSPMKALTEYRDMAFLSKELAQIRRDYDTGKTLEDFRININKDRAKELFLEYGFKSLIEKL